MRIELNAGGLSNGAAVLDFQSDFSSLAGKSRRMVQSFQNIRSAAYNMNGGVGVLQDAVDEIGSRITEDEERVEAIEAAAQKADDFVKLARKVDKSVREIVTRNTEAFYEVNPWAKPPPPPEEKSFREKAWDWCCKKAGEIKEGFDHAVERCKNTVHNVTEWAKDTLKKAWQGIKDFCNSSIGKIVISVGIVVALTALTICTGGAAAVIFGMGAIGAGAGLITGTAKGFNEYAKAKAAGKDANLLDSVANNMAKGTVNGAASGLADGIGLAGGGILGRAVAGEFLQVGSETLTGMWIDGKSGDEAFKDGLIKGTTSNIVDTATFGMTGGGKQSAEGLKLLGQKGSKAAYEQWAKNVIKEGVQEEGEKLLLYKVGLSTLTGFDSPQDLLSSTVGNILTGEFKLDDYRIPMNGSIVKPVLVAI